MDFIWLDLEHDGPDPWNASQIEDLLRAAERTDVALLVRLPDTEPTLVRKALDIGVRYVFLPRVKTADEVRDPVLSARFRYDDGPGERGLGAPRARCWGLADDYIASEDKETLVGVTIETKSSIEYLEEILTVPELRFVFIGPLDLSVSLGCPGEIDHPMVQEADETVRSKAVDADVPIAGLGFGMDDVNQNAANDYQMLNLGSTTGALEQTLNGRFDAHEQNDA